MARRFFFKCVGVLWMVGSIIFLWHGPPSELPDPSEAHHTQEDFLDAQISRIVRPEEQNGLQYCDPNHAELFARQLNFIKRLPNGGQSDAHWRNLYGRVGADGDVAVEDATYKQLCDRKLCRDLGQPPKWTRAELLDGLREFLRDVYPRRPIRDNKYGMGVNHAFLAWFYAKQRKPTYIIENGIHLGQSTWLLRDAAPNATIFSFDPKGSIIQYWDPEAQYWVGGRDFKKSGYKQQPFKDFGEMPWGEMISDPLSTLILFDDHQDHLRRISEMHAFGFKYAMFDDNWPELQGDNYSLKQICDESGGHALRRPDFPDDRVLRTDNFHMSDTFISREEHLSNRKTLHSLVRVYFEGPPPLYHPVHFEFTKTGHKPRKDTTPYDLVLPRPSNRLLGMLADAVIPKPIVQNEAEFEYVGLPGPLTQMDFGGHVCPCYVELY